MEWCQSNSPVPYEKACTAMLKRVHDIHMHKKAECLWLLEHPPLYTQGSKASHYDFIDHTSLPIYHTGRGGKTTYHGPGQRVIYTLCDLRTRNKDLRQFVCTLQEWVIQALFTLNIAATTHPEHIGVWTPEGKKIASIGLRVRQWVTYHGLALNVSTDLSAFDAITPCGISGSPMSSLHALGYTQVTMQDVDKALHDTACALITTQSFSYSDLLK